MSLDIIVSSSSSTPQKQVSIGVDEHYQLMCLVTESGGLLTRIGDYYSDAEFQLSELDSLIVELKGLAHRWKESGMMVGLLDSVVEIAEFAKGEGKSLLVVAD